MDETKEYLRKIGLNLEILLEQYGSIICQRIKRAEITQDIEERRILIDEIRLLNVVSVTCARCLALSEYERFGVVQEDLPGTLPI